ncbi:MAG: cell division protein FtsQ/DivIB [Leadbetterella sp.]
MGKLKKIALYCLLVVALVAGGATIYFANQNQSTKRCKSVEIEILNQTKLITEADVRNWITLNGSDPLDGKVVRDISLKVLEKRIKDSGFAKACEAYFDISGNLTVEVEVYEPIARVLRGGKSKDRLLAEDGTLFPMSVRHSPSVLLIEGAYFHSHKHFDKSKNQDIMLFVNTVTKDEFWNAQIPQITLDEFKEITIYPHYGNQIIEFGKPERVKGKLEKLLTFYKTLMPLSQWSKFKVVNLKYKSQIVCR